MTTMTSTDKPSSNYGSGTMFDRIATRYDFINGVLAMRMDVGWRQTMVDRVATFLAENKSAKILDIATGTAEVALLLAETIPNADIIGMDPSVNMLTIGREKVTKKEYDDRITLNVGGVETFSKDLKANTFDAATMAFGIRNVPPPREDALCNIHRVLKKKTKKQQSSMFCILEFSEPEVTGVVSYLAKLFIQYVVPVVGGILSGNLQEYIHLQNSIADFPTPNNFVDILQGLNCKNGGSFRVDDVIQMNFGSVQLYIMTP
eukprot:CAMPEP_0194174252 /NCGR_PEP_ID=MMETSP0154-20130528/8488_1 /TAXON_ID=1049557 /ORGANISM="Thalassiothrix antarctica, Strain L6-D1" /LENGTH=260 /DNA_ID=CAMNT_0038887623 /DNA_START=390 /DNA_END=1169 /DNA_ORIENTATION=-